MKKMYLVPLALIILSSFVLAADLDVKIISEDSKILAEGNDNATFVLRITNNENQADSFEIFSLAGVSIFPKESFLINAGSSIDLEITAVPHDTTRESRRGLFVFEYQIKGKDTGFYKDNLMINVIELADSIEVSSSSVSLDEDKVILTVKNLEDYDFRDLTLQANSLFFSFAETFDLGPNYERKFSVPVNNNLEGISAGEYKIDVLMKYNNNIVEEISKVNFLERGDTLTDESSSGFIIREKQIVKKNSGNIDTIVTITERKDIISRLFTTFSIKPEVANRNGFYVEYSWDEELRPGESFGVTVSTNFTLPFIILLVILIAIVGIRLWLMNKPVIIQKRVSPVRTKGGELALKVRLRVKARKSVSDVVVMERIPHMAKLYEKFGTKPDKVHQKTRQLEWNMKHLGAGEERTFTYIIYSKLNVVGRFELPATRAGFVLNGKPSEAYSNTTSFAAETAEED